MHPTAGFAEHPLSTVAVGAAGSTSHTRSQILAPDQIWFTSRTNCVVRSCAVCQSESAPL